MAHKLCVGIEIQRCELAVAPGGLAVLMDQAAGCVHLKYDTCLNQGVVLWGVVEHKVADTWRRIHVRREEMLRTLGGQWAERGIEHLEGS